MFTFLGLGILTLSILIVKLRKFDKNFEFSDLILKLTPIFIHFALNSFLNFTYRDRCSNISYVDVYIRNFKKVLLFVYSLLKLILSIMSFVKNFLTRQFNRLYFDLF
jgi:hypothetical protein